MSWNYEDKLREYIAQAQSDSGLKDENGNDFVIELCTEEIFVKKQTLTPGTIYVVIKYLSSSNTLNAVTQPIQLIISCEQNQIQASQIIFSKLVASHNFEAIIDDGTYVKQDYREPVVLSNFNEISYGYRTIMYISATLFIMENVLDIGEVTIKSSETPTPLINELFKPINFNIVYSMTPNTQQINGQEIATSVKSLSTFSITLSVPLTSEYEFIQEMLRIANGETTGNSTFIIEFTLGEVDFSVRMKLVSMQITTAINEIPSFQIGLLK